MQITKTITEHTNGRVRDEAYATGWKRRVGTEVINPEAPFTKRQHRPVWEQAPAPATYVVGSPEDLARESRGGIIHTVMTEVEPVTVTLTTDEVRLLVRHYACVYDKGLSVMNGETWSDCDWTVLEALQEALNARQAALRYGVDLDETNVAYPHRMPVPGDGQTPASPVS